MRSDKNEINCEKLFLIPPLMNAARKIQPRNITNQISRKRFNIYSFKLQAISKKLQYGKILYCKTQG